MAAEESPAIEIADDRVQVRDVVITESEVAEYLESFEDSADREDALKKALSVGVTTLELAETSQQEEYVERRFAEMQRDLEQEIDRVEREVEEAFGDNGHVPEVFETHLGDDGQLKQHLEDAFGDDGRFKQRLDEELGEGGERIQDALDPGVEGTPTYRLKQTIQQEIRALRDRLTEQEAAEEKEKEMCQKTSLKGKDFEDTVGNLLANLVHNTSHEVEETGDKIGEIGDRKVGDFVLTLNDTGLRIVVEAKSDKNYTQPMIKEELNDAIENRGADYGIIVFEQESYIPNKIGYFHEFDSERLSIALSENEEDSLEPGFLRIGFNWARTRVLRNYIDTGSAFDPETVQDAVGEIADSIDQFTTIRKKTTSIRQTANDIDKELEEIEQDVKSDLADIRTELQTTE